MHICSSMLLISSTSTISVSQNIYGITDYFKLGFIGKLNKQRVLCGDLKYLENTCVQSQKK